MVNVIVKDRGILGLGSCVMSIMTRKEINLYHQLWELVRKISNLIGGK